MKSSIRITGRFPRMCLSMVQSPLAANASRHSFSIAALTSPSVSLSDTFPISVHTAESMLILLPVLMFISSIKPTDAPFCAWQPQRFHFGRASQCKPSITCNMIWYLNGYKGFDLLILHSLVFISRCSSMRSFHIRIVSQRCFRVLFDQCCAVLTASCPGVDPFMSWTAMHLIPVPRVELFAAETGFHRGISLASRNLSILLRIAGYVLSGNTSWNRLYNLCPTSPSSLSLITRAISASEYFMVSLRWLDTLPSILWICC